MTELVSTKNNNMGSNGGTTSQNKSRMLLITNVDDKYIKNPVLLKKDLDKWSKEATIKEIKTTAANNLIIIFDPPNYCEGLKNDSSMFPYSKKIIMNDETKKRKPSHNDLEVVIKGINYRIATDSSEELKQMGIKSIIKFSNNEEFNIIKAEIIDESTLNKIIKDGLFIGYKRLKVEKFIQPVKITQCFNCQKFGHYSINCKVKEATCVKCGGKQSGNEHTSSYGGCTYKQTQIKEKLERNNMKSTNNLLKSYSSVITGNQINASEEKFKSISDEISGISDLVNRINSNLEKKINEVLDKQIIEITDSIKKVFCYHTRN
jgi:hypothetical protein